MKNNKPFLVSFSGIDGSGKTTHVDYLKNYLKRNNISYINYHTINDSLINRILSKRSKKKEVSGKKNYNKIKFINAFLRFAVCLFDVFYIRYKLRFRWRGKYQVVVFDRYFYDRIINTAYLRRLNSVKLFSSIIYLAPKPHFPVYFKADVDELMKRKEEQIKLEGQDREYFESKYQLFEKAVSEWKLFSLENTHMTKEEVKGKILSLFKKRFYRFNKKK